MLGFIFVLFQTFSNFQALNLSHTVPTPPKNAISITFDDGPHTKYTPLILDILKEKKVHATFFVIGSHIRWREKILRREVEEWHIIWNHSYSHVLFTKIPKERIITEVLLTNIKIFWVIWKIPEYFRFPYWGEDYHISLIHKTPIIGWNVDAYDWKVKNPKKLAENIVAQTKDGSIILLHDIKEDTVKALPLIIDSLRKKWYHIVPLPVLLSGKIQHSDWVVYRSRYSHTVLREKSIPTVIKTPSSESIIPTKEPVIITEIPLW